MGYRILIVDDSATTRAIIKRSIQLAQVPVDTLAEAANGKEAMSLLSASRFDLVLADLHMPEMGGAELTATMAADPRMSDIPVVVVSAEPSADRLEDLKNHGVLACLRKPFTPEQIRGAISGVLGECHA